MNKRRLRSYARSDDIVPKLEGMEVEFDEKVTLFPVELEEIRSVGPWGGKSARRNGSAVYR
jgi:hypothetical protein